MRHGRRLWSRPCHAVELRPQEAGDHTEFHVETVLGHASSPAHTHPSHSSYGHQSSDVFLSTIGRTFKFSLQSRISGTCKYMIYREIYISSLVLPIPAPQRRESLREEEEIVYHKLNSANWKRVLNVSCYFPS